MQNKKFDIHNLTKEKMSLLEYYTNESNKKLNQISKGLFSKFGGITNADYDDFYSIANEQLLYCIFNYEEEKNDNFENYLKFILLNKFKQEVTKRNRNKRSHKTHDEDGKVVFLPTLSLDAPMESDEHEQKTYGETLVDEESDIENNLYGATLSENAINYLQDLSELEREIANMIMDGYKKEDILEQLHLTDERYQKLLHNMGTFERMLILKKTNLCENTDKRKGEETMENLQTLEKSKDDRLSVASIIKKMENYLLRFDHPLQRSEGNWDSKTEGNFISDCLQRNPMPELVFAEQVVNGVAIIWNIDGKHRCTTVQRFKNNQIKVSQKITRGIVSYNSITKGENGKPVLDERGYPIAENKEFDIRGKYFKDLPEELQDIFLDYSFKIVQYLNCSGDDIAYHIERYNHGRPMNCTQKGITKIGEQFAYMVKNISAMPFFKEHGNYTVREAKNANGTIDRVVIESLMSSNFLKDWKKNQEEMCEFVKENATEEMFENLEEAVDRLTKVGNDDFFKMFTSKNSFIYFGLFARYIKEHDDDEGFVEFMAEFSQSLHSKVVNGISYDMIEENRSTSTKDKKIVIEKIELLTILMKEFFHQKNITVNSDSDEDRKEKDTVNNHIESEQCCKETEMSDYDFICRNVGKIEKADVEFYNDILDDLTLNVDNNSHLMDKENRKSLLAMVAYSIKNDVDLDEWLVSYFEHHNTYNKDQHSNYIEMKNNYEVYSKQVA